MSTTSGAIISGKHFDSDVCKKTRSRVFWDLEELAEAAYRKRARTLFPDDLEMASISSSCMAEAVREVLKALGRINGY